MCDDISVWMWYNIDGLLRKTHENHTALTWLIHTILMCDNVTFNTRWCWRLVCGNYCCMPVKNIFNRSRPCNHPSMHPFQLTDEATVAWSQIAKHSSHMVYLVLSLKKKGCTSCCFMYVLKKKKELEFLQCFNLLSQIKNMSSSHILWCLNILWKHYSGNESWDSCHRFQTSWPSIW